MSLVDEMRGRTLRGEGVLRCLWVAESGGAGGEGWWPTGGVRRVEVLVVEDKAGGGRTRGYLAVAVRVDIENNVIGLTNELVFGGI